VRQTRTEAGLIHVPLMYSPLLVMKINYSIHVRSSKLLPLWSQVQATMMFSKNFFCSFPYCLRMFYYIGVDKPAVKKVLHP